ncbi:unnamed protein product [Camellia sinensis]
MGESKVQRVNTYGMQCAHLQMDDRQSKTALEEGKLGDAVSCRAKNQNPNHTDLCGTEDEGCCGEIVDCHRRRRLEKRTNDTGSSPLDTCRRVLKKKKAVMVRVMRLRVVVFDREDDRTEAISITSCKPTLFFSSSSLEGGGGFMLPRCIIIFFKKKKTLRFKSQVRNNC